MKMTSCSGFVRPAWAAALAVVITCGLSVRTAQAGYIVTLQEVGPDVVGIGAGPIDFSGLTPGSTGTPPAQLDPGLAIIVTGSSIPTRTYSGISGPTSFGDPIFNLASSASGDEVGLRGNAVTPFIVLPASYISNGPLSSSAIWSGQTFSSLGVTPGTYFWSWGPGVNQNFTLIAAAPDSGSTLGLLLVSLLALVGVSRFRPVRLA